MATQAFESFILFSLKIFCLKQGAEISELRRCRIVSLSVKLRGVLASRILKLPPNIQDQLPRTAEIPWLRDNGRVQKELKTLSF